MGVKKHCFLMVILLMVFVLPACKTLKMTPILKAAEQGQMQDLNQLLAEGTSVNSASPEGVTPLFVASMKGHEDIVRRLIERGADVNAVVKLNFKFENETIYQGRTSLMAALSKKHTGIAEMLIQRGANVNAADINGATPLFIAAALNDEGIVKTLIEKGADLNAVIQAEYIYKDLPVCKGATALMAALKMNQNANAALLIARGADLNAKCEDGTDALMIAAENGDPRMATFLLSHGASHQTRVTRDNPAKGKLAFAGDTALIIAARTGNVDVVNALIKAGADVNAASENGTTPLFNAAGNGHLEVVKVLVANGANVNARLTKQFRYGIQICPKGVEALGGAAWEGHDKVAQFLIDNGADVNSREDDFTTNALYMAARQGHIKVVKILIDNGADVWAETKMGTAYDAAIHYMHPYVAQCIDDARKKMNEVQGNEAQEE